MASSLLNKLKLIAGESIDTIDPTDPPKTKSEIGEEALFKYMQEFGWNNEFLQNERFSDF